MLQYNDMTIDEIADASMAEQEYNDIMDME